MSQWNDEIVRAMMILAQHHKPKKVTELINKQFGTDFTYHAVRAKINREKGKEVVRTITTESRIAKNYEPGKLFTEKELLEIHGYDPSEFAIDHGLSNEWQTTNKDGQAYYNFQMRQHESIVVFYKKQCTYNRQMTVSDNPNFKNRRGKGSTFGDIYGNQISSEFTKEKLKNPVSIIKFNKQAKECNSSNRVHPTQKPIDLFEYLIKTYTNENEIVLDNVIGSGTTAVAAINTGRNFIGIEKEWEYCEIANERIKEAIELKSKEDEYV